MISSSQHTSSQSKTTIDKRLYKITMNDNEKDLEKDKYNQESKDDCAINDNDNMNENDINIMVPSFIRLFVTRRIIDKYIKNNKDQKKKTKEEIIKELSNVFKDDKHKNESLVINIVTRLISFGIKQYMSKYYDEKELNIIEDIFNKIILEKFGQEYNEINKYGINNDKTNDNYFESLLFNSSDLMNQIFQYLVWGDGFDEDLYSCSLVSSHWLYHVWNVNSVYHINFNKLVKYNSDNNRTWTRIWQRLYNVKSIKIDLDADNSKAAFVTSMNKLSTFRKVEKVNVYVYGADANKCISAVIPIMSPCKDRINYCRIVINGTCIVLDPSNFKAPPPLRLPKAQYVCIGDLFFYRIWTNECTQLKLSDLSKISKDWCKFVIENCDCTNVTTLTLNWVTFDDKSINEITLKQFALKFHNLKTFEIKILDDDVDDDNVLLFWQLLKPILSKNKTKVKLKVAYLQADQAISLSKRMDEKDLKIDKLIIDDMDRDNRGLNHLTIEHEMSENEGKKLLSELKCKSITTFELKFNDVKLVNLLLEWKMITEKQIFVIIDVCEDYSHYDNSYSNSNLSVFKQLYKNIYQLFLKQIALDIKTKFGKVKDSKVFESHLSLYSSYFTNSEFLSKYNSPNRDSSLCLPRSKPCTYFYIHDSKKEDA